MDAGTIAQWLAVEGTFVTAGQPIYALESEKSVQEIEAPVSGTLHIFETAGTTLKVGTVIAEIT